MSDELDTVAKVGGASVGSAGITAVFVRWLWARKDRAEDQEKADLRERIAKLEATQEKMVERLNGALEKHSERIDSVKDMATRTDERVKLYARRVGEPVTNAGHKMSPEMQALVAQYKGNDGE